MEEYPQRCTIPYCPLDDNDNQSREALSAGKSDSIDQDSISVGMEQQASVDGESDNVVVNGGENMAREKYGESSAEINFGLNTENEGTFARQQMNGEMPNYAPGPLVYIPLEVYHRFVENTNYLHYVLSRTQFPFHSSTFAPFTNSFSNNAPQHFSMPVHSWPTTGTHPHSYYNNNNNNFLGWPDTTTTTSSHPYAYPATEQAMSNICLYPQQPMLHQAWLPTTPRHFRPQIVISPTEHTAPCYCPKSTMPCLHDSPRYDWRQRNPNTINSSRPILTPTCSMAG